MTIDEKILVKLSAYLDGELNEADTRAVEILAEKDPEIAAELEELSRADAAIGEAFGMMLNDPVPIGLARAIENAPATDPEPAATPANRTTAPRFGFGSMVAGLALLIAGGVIGAYAMKSFAPEPDPETIEVAMGKGWIAEVADYHRIYAGQTRHLVEVPASEQDHIETWLSNTTGVPFEVPDLAPEGWTFEGGRLLVAASKPVAQLLYKDAQGKVVALCFLQGGDEATEGQPVAFNTNVFDDIETVSWKTPSASYVVVGPSEGVDLPQLAEQVAMTI
jgi:anti-sigma factor RsiW